MLRFDIYIRGTKPIIMLFNSLEFAVFIPVVFLLYWFVFERNIKFQNLLVVVASYAFYGWWDYRFLALLLFSTAVDYSMGRLLENESRPTHRKFWLWSSVAVNLGFLGYFKYYNFFIESFVDAFTFFGRPIEVRSLNIILPVGISFYTFQTLSYTIDVYKKRLTPTRDFIAFAAFVSFFPQLVAGPIERASQLLPQFYKKRVFHYDRAVEGMRQILWGLFKKMVVADNSAELANYIFGNSDSMNGSALLLGAFFFTIQIYADFSGYSDIALGLARLFGFRLSKNFNFPYFARSLPETWTKWHISLTTWFRDYLFIPLAFKAKKQPWKLGLLMVFQFVVIGIWHGANWTFVFWGLLQAGFMMPYTINRKRKPKYSGPVSKGRLFPKPDEALHILKTFGIVVLTMVFFRAENIQHGFQYVAGVFSTSLFAVPSLPDLFLLGKAAFFTVLFLTLEWIARHSEYGIDFYAQRLKPAARYAFYYLLILFIVLFMGVKQDYLYFQF